MYISDLLSELRPLERSLASVRFYLRIPPCYVAIVRMKKSSSGFSLIEVLVSLAILSILCFAMITVMSNMNRESRGLTEKLGSLTLQGELSQITANPDLCSKLVQNFGGKQFNSSDLTTAKIELDSIGFDPASPVAKVGELASPLSTSLRVKSIELTNFTSTGVVDNYSARLVVQYDPAVMVRALLPAVIKLQLRTSGAGATKTVIDCSSAQSSLNFANCYQIDEHIQKGMTVTKTCNAGYRLVFGSGLRDGSQDPVNSTHFRMTNDSIMVRANRDAWRMLGKCCKEE
ncbi:MAG: type II secretion system protein [Proteobacteria bacterium]|nr:MAG: type II secretion system protein [Pseudomonadota bacterium]